MANIYWGDGVGTPVLDGNWNNPANWYLTLGSVICGCPVAGTPANRVPQPGDSVVIAGTATADITRGPANWAGSVSWLLSGGSGYTVGLKDPNATFSGIVTVTGNGGGSCMGVIKAGNFPGTVNLQTGGVISGGVFTGKVNRTLTAGVPQGIISGGAYGPTAILPLQPFTSPPASVGNAPSPAVAYQLPPSSVALLPADPGFAVGGGQYAPVIIITGVP